MVRELATEDRKFAKVCAPAPPVRLGCGRAAAEQPSFAELRVGDKPGNRMHRFVIFVDGSNFAGALRRLNLRVDNYEPVFRHVFEGATKAWRTTFDGANAPAQLHRVK